MGNTQGSGTWQRCAFHLMQPEARPASLPHPEEEVAQAPVRPVAIGAPAPEHTANQAAQ